MNEQAIRKLQATLLKIKNKDPVFFNVAQFESLGLVKSRQVASHKRDSGTGEALTRTSWYLTPKAVQILAVVV